MGQDNTNEPPCVKSAARVEPLGARPLRAAILIGGRSRRMGTDKAGLTLDGSTLVRRIAEWVRGSVEQVAVVGEGARVEGIAGAIHLDDAPGVRGPIAGVLAALEYDSACDWLVLACDMPAVGVEAIEWLMDRHTSNVAATLGRLPDCEYPEPLLAIYSGAALPVLRDAVRRREPALHRALRRMQTRIHAIPPSLAPQWLNINTPEQWREFLENQSSR